MSGTNSDVETTPAFGSCFGLEYRAADDGENRDSSLTLFCCGTEQIVPMVEEKNYSSDFLDSNDAESTMKAKRAVGRED